MSCASFSQLRAVDAISLLAVSLPALCRVGVGFTADRCLAIRWGEERVESVESHENDASKRVLLTWTYFQRFWSLENSFFPHCKTGGVQEAEARKEGEEVEAWQGGYLKNIENNQELAPGITLLSSFDSDNNKQKADEPTWPISNMVWGTPGKQGRTCSWARRWRGTPPRSPRWQGCLCGHVEQFCEIKGITGKNKRQPDRQRRETCSTLCIW